MAVEEVKALEAAFWTSGIGGALLGLRWLFKTFRKDVQEVRFDDEQDKVIQHWKDIAARYQKEALEQSKRADTFADQRNKAIEEVGQLKGEVRALSSHIQGLETQISAMQKTVRHLEAVLSKCGGCEVGKAMRESLEEVPEAPLTRLEPISMPQARSKAPSDDGDDNWANEGFDSRGRSGK